jgi:hypothetical protein
MDENEQKGTLTYFPRINSIVKLIIKEHFAGMLVVPEGVDDSNEFLIADIKKIFTEDAPVPHVLLSKDNIDRLVGNFL